MRWWLQSGEDPARVEPLLRAALRALDDGHAVNLKSGRRKELYPLGLLPGGAVSHLLKVNHYRAYHGWRRRLLAFLGYGSKSRHELAVAEAVRSRGVSTPVPLAAGERRVGGRLHSCFLLTPHVSGVTDLRRLWIEPRARPAERRRVAHAFGELARRIHDAGILQDDFAPNNFLVGSGAEPRLQMIDFERAHLLPIVHGEARRFMLAKLDREIGAAASTTARWRFLLSYARGERSAARRWWRQVESFAPHLARRDHERLERNAVSQGRRFRRVEAPGWTGWLQGDPLRPALLGRLARGLERAETGSEPSVADLGDAWAVRVVASEEREEARVWATAQMLHARGLAPLPRAWLRRAGVTILVLERGPVTVSAFDGRRARDRDALRVLLHRLLALGEWRGDLSAESVAIERQHGAAPRALLLAPHALHLTGRAQPGARAHARELAGSLTDQRAAGPCRP